MPINYLESQDSNMGALRRMGSTFSDAVINMAEAQARRREMIQRAMIENQYLQLAQQKQAQDMQLGQQKMQMGQQDMQAAQAAMAQQNTMRQLAPVFMAGPQALSQTMQDPSQGPMIAATLRQQGVLPGGQVQMSPQEMLARIGAALRGGMVSTAAMNPAASVNMLQPYSTRQGEIGRDPMSNEVIYNNPMMMSPYQQQGLDEDIRHHKMLEQHNQELETIYKQRADTQQQAVDKKPDISQGNPIQQLLQQKLGAALGGGGQSQVSNVQSFGSEQEARSAGAKSGDVIVIKGVGKVRLN